MQSSTNRAQRFARGFFLITAFVLLQHLAVTSVVADTATPTCPCSIWSSAINPGPEAVDNSPTGVNLGLKFHSDVDGYIKAVRFYKHPGNTGTHTGYLWSLTDTTTPLGTVTFSGETASGWQEAAFSSPIPITAGTDYIASYYAPNRAWPHNLDFFHTLGVDSPPLHVIGGFGNNGVFAYGDAGLFPADSPGHPSNYLVDVVFEGTLAPNTTPPTVAATTPAASAFGVDPNGNVEITFSKEI
ncbi:MAG TPA: DUF4082 domain-containing protein, partial [Gemmatimonadaceae bacterium]